MVVNLLNNIKLSGHNEHLTDIFTEDCYLEIGNIHYHILQRLLDYEEIDFKEICSFDIFNSGLGKSNIPNEELKDRLPFYFFENINKKNQSIQIFLTYGLFSYLVGTTEKFAPIVLIPVNIFLKDRTITFQMLSKPIENRSLIDVINTNNKAINNALKLDSLINIDRYVLGFDQIDGSHVSFESFLTFGKTRTVNLRLEHKAFSFRKESGINYKSIKNVIENDDIFSVDLLSKDQRQALLSARNGNSFAISGRVGTGKTTALINIAIDQMAQGKKVLYVSNVQETKKQVLKKLQNTKLDSFFLDLTVPFAELPPFVYNTSKTEELDYKMIVGEVISKYKEIQDFENKLFGRVCDFRYNEVLTELALLSNKEVEFKQFDDLTVIYKHEYEEIIESIKIICDKVKKLNKLGVESINSSKFSEIPVNLDNYLLNYNAIVKVLTTIRDLFSELLEKKILLEKKYGFNNIINFGRLGFIRIYVDGLNVNDVPKSWIENTGNVFKQAKLKFSELQNDMEVLHSMHQFLNETYTDLDNLNLDYEIGQILGYTYKINDSEKIDYINSKRDEINKLINRGGVEKETFLNMSKKIRALMKLNLNDEIKNINEMVRFADYLCENRVDPVWIKYMNDDFMQRTIQKISESKKYIEEFNIIYKRFEKKIPKFPLEEVPNLLIQLTEYENETSSRKKKEYSLIHAYRKKNNLSSLSEELAIVQELNTYLKDINQHRSRYEKLVGHKYILGDDPVGGITKLNEYIKSIKNPIIKKHIIEFLSSVEWDFKLDDKASNHVIFNLYRNSYRNIMDIYEELHKYVPLKNQLKMTPIINDMMAVFQYFREIFSSNDRVRSCIINFNKPYVPVSEYLILKNRLNDLYNHQQMLVQHDEYKFLYEKYYLDVDTNCDDISKILEFYDNYTQVFRDYELCVKSLHFRRRSDILEIFKEIKNIFELMGLNITTYNTIFKNSFTISYYNNSFTEVISYLDKLLDSKEELSLYLDTVNAVQTVMKHKLYRWTNYLTNTKNIENIIDDFKYSYFKVINDMYLETNEIISSKNLMNKLNDLYLELKSICAASEKEALNKIKKYTLYKTTAKFNGDFDEYIIKTSNVKRIYFTNTKVLNNYISISNFDVVLIDDIQTSSSSDYGIALRANQVVFAGVEQLQTLFSNDVISRMRKSNVLSLKKRYYPTPKLLVNNMEKANSLICCNKSDNVGIDKIQVDVSLFVLTLLNENKKYKINVYSNNISTKRRFYEDFATLALKEGYDEREIFDLLTNNINVCDVCEEYLVDSDYNIVYLNDYASIKYDNNATNMYDFILQTKKKLFFYDPQNLIESEGDGPSLFINKIKLLFASSLEVFNKVSNDKLISALSKAFKSQKIKVYDHHDELDLLLEYKNRLYGVMLYFNHDISTFETITNFLECNKLYANNNIKVFNLMLNDLSIDLNEKVMNICKEIIHGKAF